jgi:hypothetical protein
MESLGDVKQDWIKQEMGEEQYGIYKTIQSIRSYSAIQMRMPMEFN